MKSKISNYLLLLLFLMLSASIIISCGGDRYKKNTNTDTTKKNLPTKIKKVTIFIENSGSIVGFVNGGEDYIKVVAELSQKLDWTKDNVNTVFYFVNGDNKMTLIGTDPNTLKNKLNSTSYNCGDPATSNLTEMFNTALKNAGGDSISILISDGIYDVGKKINPLNALEVEAKSTSNKFVERLKNGNLQTLMIKLSSLFNGDYCYGIKNSSIKINQQRPYYVWIFGETSLLNKYFSEDYVETLSGYDNMVRFFNIDTSGVPYQACTFNKLGDFIFDKSDNNTLLNAEKDSHSQDFQFTIAVDFSSLPYSEKYLTDISNYSCTNDYSIDTIQRYDPSSGNKIYGVSFTPTHLITVYNNKTPYGTLIISLKNNIPSWIALTNTNDDSNITNDIEHTFGFKNLTDAISDAYKFMFKQKNIADLEITIIK